MADVYQQGDDRPHVDSDTCGKCRQKFSKGHRVAMALIVKNVGLDAKNLAVRGAYLSDEFELVHTNCNDPFLRKGIKS